MATQQHSTSRGAARGPGARRRRPLPALQPWERQLWLRIALVQRYAEHPPFCAALEALWTTHAQPQAAALAAAPEFWQVQHAAQAGVAWAQTYSAAVLALARKWGLDRLGWRGATTSDGIELLHTWCYSRAHAPGHHWPPAWLVTSLAGGGPRPDVGDLVWEAIVHEHEDLAPDGQRRRVRVVDTERVPRVRVQLTATWDPRTEPRAQARARLLAALAAQLDAELERLSVQTEAAGYVFPDTAPQLGHVVRWLFAHVALRQRYSEIARATDSDPQTVARRVWALARQLDLRLRDT
ncbi:MAG: hypothetical protein IRZ14_19155 [Chloroflexi bacterium]|nr:hypothetical protein [Chloroflexota bacterium]